MTFRKAGGRVATEGSGSEDTSVEVILQTAKEALGGIAVGGGASAHHGTGTLRIAQFAHERVEQMVVAAAQALGRQVIILVTGEQVDIVQTGEIKLVFSKILLVHRPHAAVAHIHITVRAGGTGKLAGEGAVAGIVGGKANIGRERQTRKRSKDGSELSGQHVSILVGVVILVVTDGIAHDGRTFLVGVVGIVNLTAAFLIEIRIALLVHFTHIQRIDRADAVGDVEQVAGGTVAVAPVCLLGIRVGEVHRGDEPHPGLSLIFSIDTTGVTLIVGVVHDTRVLQVTDRSVVVEAVGTTGSGNVVLLTISIVESFLVPIIRNIIVFTIRVSEFSIRIQLEVGTDEVLAFRNGIDQVTQTAVLLVKQVLVRISIAFGNSMTGILVLVVQPLEEGLVVQTGIGDHVVLGDQAGVDTETGVELDLRITGLTLLGGDDHNTVRAAVTIDGGGGSVLQDRHGFDVLRVDVGNGTIVRNAIHHDKRAVGSGHGTDTTDADRISTTTCRVAAGAGNLHTRGSTGKSARYAGRNFLLDGLVVNDRRRSRKGTLGSRTIRNDDGFVQELAVILEDDVDVGATGYGDILSDISHTKHLKDTVCRNIQRERTRDVRHGINRTVAFQNDIGTDDSFTGGILHGTLHSDILCGSREG